MYPYGLIGNCQASALVREDGALDWLCFPRPDSPPIFGGLLDPDGGRFTIEPEGEPQGAGRPRARQSYLPNTNVLVTDVELADGSAYRITDFCPRFFQHGRLYRPNAVYRIVEPTRGTPKIRVVCQPVRGWSKEPVPFERGNSHLRYAYPEGTLKLTTTMSLTYLSERKPFVLEEALHFALTWDLGVEDDLKQVAVSFRDLTVDYWQTWVKHCAIPTRYQKETIRSALALKLHVYEDTGAILAALTTSLPEEADGTRNWDYRFCWLRDASFVLTAFHNLGHFEETEGFLKFILNLAESQEENTAAGVTRLKPVYRLDQTLPLPELEHPEWAGFAGGRPVRSGNQAAEHVQHDVYGEMVLALAPIFFDERFRGLRGPAHERLLARLGQLCAASISQPDAGLWELRDGWREHSFSNLMCWAGLERLERIREQGYLQDIGFDLSAERARAEAAVRAAVKQDVLGNGPGDETQDAALLLLSVLRFPDAKLAKKTIDRIRADLGVEHEGRPTSQASFLYRYLRRDDFGRPQSAFLICSFWLVQALARSGRMDEGRQALDDTMSSANSLGLFSEHYLPAGKLQSGNFPQAYSHVGQINAAFAVSPPWSEIL